MRKYSIQEYSFGNQKHLLNTINSAKKKDIICTQDGILEAMRTLMGYCTNIVMIQKIITVQYNRSSVS